MAQLEALNLGWGVQSWTMAAMVAMGELTRPDLVVHSDTTLERRATYEFIAQWEPWLAERGVHVVTVRNDVQPTMVATNKTDIPAFTINSEGGRGQIRRQCTGRWKIESIRARLREELEARGLKKVPGVVDQWLGISMDEFHRVKHADVQWVRHVYPLLDKRMTRADCVAWLTRHGLPVPPKSACTICPFHTKAAWIELKRENGPDWKQALDVDAALRNVRPPHPLFLHQARKPLDEAVVLPADNGQIDMFAPVEDGDLATCDSGHCFM